MSRLSPSTPRTSPISVGQAYPGKDVAILKLDGETHLPTLPLGTNEDVAEGDTLYVASYPAASTFFSGLSKDSEVQPTITQGPLTAIRSNPAGTPIFQTQAPASPGNSGGPAFDDTGKVIGILVASAVDNKGNALEGQEFIIPASVITEKLNQVNVKPRTSDTTVVYNQALDAYYKHYYKRALPLFQKTSNLYAGHPYVDDFISQSQSAIDSGKDETPPGPLFWALIGGGVLVAFVLLLGLFLLLLRRRKLRNRAAGSGQPGQYSQPGQYPQPGQPCQYPQPTQYGQPGQYPQPGQYGQYPPSAQYPPQARRPWVQPTVPVQGARSPHTDPTHPDAPPEQQSGNPPASAFPPPNSPAIGDADPPPPR